MIFFINFIINSIYKFFEVKTLKIYKKYLIDFLILKLKIKNLLSYLLLL